MVEVAQHHYPPSSCKTRSKKKKKKKVRHRRHCSTHDEVKSAADCSSSDSSSSSSSESDDDADEHSPIVIRGRKGKEGPKGDQGMEGPIGRHGNDWKCFGDFVMGRVSCSTAEIMSMTAKHVGEKVLNIYTAQLFEWSGSSWVMQRIGGGCSSAFYFHSTFGGGNDEDEGEAEHPAAATSSCSSSSSDNESGTGQLRRCRQRVRRRRRKHCDRLYRVDEHRPVRPLATAHNLATGDLVMDGATGNVWELLCNGCYKSECNIKGPQGERGLQGDGGMQGASGPTGPSGFNAALCFGYTIVGGQQFENDELGNDLLRFGGSSTATTATLLRFSTIVDGVDLSSFLDGVGNSPSRVKALLRISNKYNPLEFVIYEATAVATTSFVNERNVTVSVLVNTLGASFTPTDQVLVSWSLYSSGPSGASGPVGPSVSVASVANPGANPSVYKPLFYNVNTGAFVFAE